MQNINPEKKKSKNLIKILLLLEQRQKYTENCIITGIKTKNIQKKEEKNHWVNQNHNLSQIR